MSDLESLRALARVVRLREFVSRYPFGFLRDRPSTDAANPGAAALAPETTETFGGRTQGFKRDFAGEDRWAEVLAGEPPLRALYIVESKRTPAERITIGRGRGCDMVLRFPSVSKVHAFFVVRDGRVIALGDSNSANGTFVNDQRVVRSAPSDIHFGDRLRFGTAAFDWIGAEPAYALLRAT